MLSFLMRPRQSVKPEVGREEGDTESSTLCMRKLFFFTFGFLFPQDLPYSNYFLLFEAKCPKEGDMGLELRMVKELDLQLRMVKELDLQLAL